MLPRKFIQYDGQYAGSTYDKMIKVFYRMCYVNNTITHIRARKDEQGKLVGWLLIPTTKKLDEHTKQFLREKGWPVPGKSKCKLSICQERGKCTGPRYPVTPHPW